MANLCAWILCFILSFFIQGSTAGSSCHTGFYDYTYCTYGCCSSSYSSYEKCCRYSSYYNSYIYDDTNWVGIIVGSSIGGIVFLAIVITTCVCACIKMNRSPVVVQPAPPQPGPTVVMTGAGQGQSGDGYVNPQMNQFQAGPSQQFQAGPSQGPVPPPYTGPPMTANPVDTGIKAPPPAQY